MLQIALFNGKAYEFVLRRDNDRRAKDPFFLALLVFTLTYFSISLLLYSAFFYQYHSVYHLPV